jgi:uncharacterized membrane protein YkvA (DUF1232 family)
MNYDFKSILNNNVSVYNGEHKDIIKKAPELYDLATKLLRDPLVNMEFRSKLLVAIGYLAIPNDLYPEDEHGPIGYVEDIMLLLHIFRDINSNAGRRPLLQNWSGSEAELKAALGENFITLKNSFPQLYEEVLKFTGV